MNVSRVVSSSGKPRLLFDGQAPLTPRQRGRHEQVDPQRGVALEVDRVGGISAWFSMPVPTQHQKASVGVEYACGRRRASAGSSRSCRPLQDPARRGCGCRGRARRSPSRPRVGAHANRCRVSLSMLYVLQVSEDSAPRWAARSPSPGRSARRRCGRRSRRNRASATRVQNVAAIFLQRSSPVSSYSRAAPIILGIWVLACKPSSGSRPSASGPNTAS